MCDIANTFNNYFAIIAKTLKRSIKYSHKHFSDYLQNENGSTVFLKPIDKEEIACIIPFLNSNKISGPSRTPYRVLFLLKNEISKQFFFMTDAFPLVLKTAKVAPIFKKDSTLDHTVQLTFLK